MLQHPLFLALCALWFASELLIDRRRSIDAASRRDAGTLRLLHATIALSVAAGVLLAMLGAWREEPELTTLALPDADALLRRQLSAPEVFSSYVAVGDFEGYLHLLSQVDGHFVGRKKIDGDGLQARPLVVGDWIYAYGNSGKLVGLTIR